ncbi:beta-phosphoglucomutase [Bacillaceae bacterium IKA-2]|nr:beta-phosphoglucomutase [Bacillaceae bacterium IKA-2]
MKGLKEMKELKAVIFDLDGVITDTAQQHYLAWKQLADELGIPFDKNFNEKLKGVSRMESLQLILENGNLQDSYTKEEKLVFAIKKNDHYKQLIEEITPTDILPGMKELLQQLRDHHIKIGLASASKNALTVLNRLKLTEFFDTIIDASMVVNGKPDPEIFLKAASALRVEVDQCVGIEDAEAGVQSIKSAGIFAVGVGSPEAMAKADIIVQDTKEITLDFIKERFQ